MRFVGVLVLVAVALSALPGCRIVRDIARPAPPSSPSRFTRDTPEEAVDYLVDAFRSRRVLDIYESLDPEFIRENGNFSSADFATGYERLETSFREDAEKMDRAERDPVVMKDGRAWIFVHGGGSSVWLAFENHPASVVRQRDDVVPEIRGTLPADLATGLQIQEDGLVVAWPAQLQGQGPFLDPAAVTRVEFHDDWLLRSVQEPQNIRFVERLRELQDQPGPRQ